jgi:predicted nucleotidyltransferase
MTQDKLNALLSRLRIELARLLGKQLDALYLYGSRARGDALPDSDVDVLVVILGDFDYFDMVERTGQIAAELSLEYETVVSLAFTSKENYVHRMSPFLMNVRQEGIAV